MPRTISWEKFIDNDKSIPIMKDANASPMIHFLPAFMQYYNITNEDLSILTNHQATSTNEAWVNGQRVSTRDITCKNGYIHKIDGVVATVMALDRAIRCGNESGESVYDGRGILMI